MLVLHPQRRVFALLDAHSMTLFVGQANALGRWSLQGGEVVPVAGELRADDLTRSLSAFRQANHLQDGAAVHWFLPPDMLSVVWLPKATEPQRLVLPFPADQVQSGIMNEDGKGAVWLWMHQTWAVLLCRAAENAKLHSLYVHPRQVLLRHSAGVAKSDKAKVASEGWGVVHDGQYRHIYCENLMLRSIALGEDHTSESADLRLKLELNALVAARCDPSSHSAVFAGVQTSVRDLGQELLTPGGRSQNPISALKLSAAELHRAGLMTGSLTPYTEARLWGLTTVVLAASAMLAGVMTLQYWQARATTESATQELKRLAPEARQLADVRSTLTRRKDVLNAVSRVSALPNAMANLGVLSDGLPGQLTLQSVKLNVENAEIRASIAPGAQSVGADWPPQLSSYKAFISSEQDNGDTNGDGVRTYRAQAAPHTP